MASLAKCFGLARTLKDNLAQRTALAVTESVLAATGGPVLVVGTDTIGAPGARIHIVPEDWSLAKDVLGNSANIFSPSVIRICFEANNAAGAAADVNGWDTLLPIVGAAIQTGAKVEIYESANGDAPDDADITAANLKATFNASARDGIIANV